MHRLCLQCMLFLQKFTQSSQQCLCLQNCSQIWFEYQNLYKKMLSDYSEEEIEKLKEFFQFQVSKYYQQTLYIETIENRALVYNYAHVYTYLYIFTARWTFQYKYIMVYIQGHHLVWSIRVFSMYIQCMYEYPEHVYVQLYAY